VGSPSVARAGFDLVGTPERRGACPECGAEVAKRTIGLEEFWEAEAAVGDGKEA
jgi:hypothetical protein